MILHADSLNLLKANRPVMSSNTSERTLFDVLLWMVSSLPELLMMDPKYCRSVLF